MTSDKDIINRAFFESSKWLDAMSKKGSIVWVFGRDEGPDDQQPREHLKAKMSTGPHRPSLQVFSVTNNSEHVRGADAEVDLLKECLGEYGDRSDGKDWKWSDEKANEIVLHRTQTTLNINDLIEHPAKRDIAVVESRLISPMDSEGNAEEWRKYPTDAINTETENNIDLWGIKEAGKYVMKCKEKNLTWTFDLKPEESQS
jgi:hypothetical protein